MYVSLGFMCYSVNFLCAISQICCLSAETVVVYLDKVFLILSHQVMAVKKNIEDVQGKDNYPCGQQLLIHNGKVLKDETTLVENKVSEDGFLVVMLSKVYFFLQ